MTNNLQEKLLKNNVFANILMLVFILGGVLGVISMVREVFPEVKFDVVSVTIPDPGSDPDEVEERICMPIEEGLEGIAGIKNINTTASEGAGVVSIEIKDGEDPEAIKDEIKNRIDAITTFPRTSERPIISMPKLESDVLMI